MLQEEIVPYFKELGFTEYESKVYLSLLSNHPLTAYAISQKSGVPHSRVYDIARRLINKGAVLLAGKNPESFSPLAPEELIYKLKKSHKRFIDELEKRLEKISFKSDFDPVWNLSSYKDAMTVAKNLIDEAKNLIYIGIWDNELEELLPALKAAHDRGVKIVFLIYGKATVDFGEIFYHNTEHIKGITELGKTLECVVDSISCISGSLGGEKPCQIVWTKNIGLVKSIEEYIIHDFYLSEVQQIMGKQVEDIFGKNLAKLRLKYER